MNIDEYRKFKELVDTYYEKRNKNVLKEIRNVLDTKKSIRRAFIKEMENYARYIELFDKKDQIKIGISILNRESHHKFSVSKIVIIFLYIPNKVLDEILINANTDAISDLTYEIKNMIRNDFSYEEELFKPNTNKKYSKKGYMHVLKKMYRRCKR